MTDSQAVSMNDAMLNCPSCGAAVPLTESLAAPLIQATEERFRKLLAQKDADAAKREAAFRERESLLDEREQEFERRIEERLDSEKKKIEADARKNAERALKDEMAARDRKNAELEEILRSKDEKLAAARKDQEKALRMQRELEEAKQEISLTVEKQVNERVFVVRLEAQKIANEEASQRIAEKEKTIADMKKQLEEAQRKAEQGSQQLQGEVQELELEALLRAGFPADMIDPVPKGEYGGDVIQRVLGPLGQSCGIILWESKRTKNWSDKWLLKLREDQRAAKAEYAVIVSQALPVGVETFGFMEGIWIVHPRATLPVATLLRQSLMDIGAARNATEGQKTKMELVYHYLTGPQFRQRLEAVIEAFSTMQEDLQKEKKALMKQWQKREMQLGIAMQATVGMYGDFQGIAGKTLMEIESLELPALNGPPREE